jgi:hypothetical protein
MRWSCKGAKPLWQGTTASAGGRGTAVLVDVDGFQPDNIAAGGSHWSTSAASVWWGLRQPIAGGHVPGVKVQLVLLVVIHFCAHQAHPGKSD